MSKAEEARRREARLAARLKENIKRRKVATRPQPDATKPPQPETDTPGHTTDTPRRD